MHTAEKNYDMNETPRKSTGSVHVKSSLLLLRDPVGEFRGFSEVFRPSHECVLCEHQQKMFINNNNCRTLQSTDFFLHLNMVSRVVGLLLFFFAARKWLTHSMGKSESCKKYNNGRRKKGKVKTTSGAVQRFFFSVTFRML